MLLLPIFNLDAMRNCKDKTHSTLRRGCQNEKQAPGQGACDMVLGLVS